MNQSDAVSIIAIASTGLSERIYEEMPENKCPTNEKGPKMSILAIAALSLQASSAPEVTISDFVGEITLEQGPQLSVQVERQAGNEAVDVAEAANTITIDGGQSTRRWGCYGRSSDQRVGPNRSSAKAFDDYPRLVITSPEPVNLKIERSIVEAVTMDLSELNLGARACGRFVAGDIAGDTDIGLGGSMIAMIGNIGGDASLSLSGSGSIEAGTIEGGLEGSISGSGDLSAGRIGGDVSFGGSGSGQADFGDVGGTMSVRLSGSGDVTAGDVRPLTVSTSGSADVEVGDVSGPIAFRATGSGDLSAQNFSGLTMSTSGSSAFSGGTLEGPFDASLSGSGRVSIEAGRAEPFTFGSSGSGSANFGGTAVNADIRLSGSGGARVGLVEGAQSVRSSGSGRFRVTGNSN